MSEQNLQRFERKPEEDMDTDSTLDDGEESLTESEDDHDNTDSEVESGVKIVVDDKYDSINSKDLDLYKSIPKEKKKGVIIPVCAIAPSEWDEHEHFEKYGINFGYAEHYQERSRDYKYHVQEMQDVKKKVQLLLSGKAAHELHLRGTS